MKVSELFQISKYIEMVIVGLNLDLNLSVLLTSTLELEANGLGLGCCWSSYASDYGYEYSITSL